MGIKRGHIIFMGTMKEWTDDLYTDDPKPFSWCSGGRNGRRIDKSGGTRISIAAKTLPHLYIATEHNNDMEEKAI